MSTSKRDGRKAQRVAVEVPVTIVGNPHGPPRGALKVVFDTGDVSRSGAFLRSSSLLELGERVVLELQLGSKRIRVTAKVVRIQQTQPHGMGVLFEDLASEARDALDSHLGRR
jgi:hypothetical protein